MFTETDLYPRDGVRDAVRRIVSAIDKAVYGLLGLSYQLFFSIASADIFSTGILTKFYGRVQLIIGVFVLFQLAMTVLKGIVNPDGFMDSKSGAGNIVMRICTALVMLTLIVPINIPSASNEYEKQINNNGLLFGTLYSLQHRILSNNTIAKVVMGVGNNKEDSNYMSDFSNDGLKESSNIFVSTILKGFYRINLLPEGDRKHDSNKEDDQINDNRVCKDISAGILDEYKKINADPGTIIDNVNETCSVSSSMKEKYSIERPAFRLKTKLYVFTFMPVVSSLIGILFVVIMISFCVDVAVRAIKLGILRLLAPIPIINYMDPKGGKDGAFGAWVKALTSTYLDLFIRVAAVYFIIFMIQQMLVHGIATSATGSLKSWTVLFIWVGLFYFAKEAPKFIKQVLGLKDDGSGTGLFSGMGKILGLGAGIGATAAGTIGSFRASRQASIDADKANEAATTGFRGLMNRGKHLAAGIAGGVAGGVTGATAAINAKDHKGRAAFDAITKRNTADLARGRNGSTLFGRTNSMGERLLLGEDSYEKMSREIAGNEAKSGAGSSLYSYLEGKATTDYSGATVTAQGITTSLDEFNREKNAAIAKRQREGGDGTFTIGGRTFHVDDGATGKFEQDIIKAAGTAYWNDKAGHVDATGNALDGGLDNMVAAWSDTGGNARDMDALKKEFKSAKTAAETEKARKGYQKAQADHGASGGK